MILLGGDFSRFPRGVEGEKHTHTPTREIKEETKHLSSFPRLFFWLLFLLFSHFDLSFVEYTGEEAARKIKGKPKENTRRENTSIDWSAWVKIYECVR